MNLKEELCKHLIDNNLVEELDVIKHSYSTSRMNDWKKRNIELNNMCPTLDTRCDCLGVVVRNGDDDMIINPLKDKTPYGWHFEQNVYDVNGEVRSLKAAQGSGNMLKIIEEGQMSDKIILYDFDSSEKFLKDGNRCLGEKEIFPSLLAKGQKYAIKDEEEHMDAKDYIIYDDYNSNIRKDQTTIGTLTTNCGNDAIRNGWKIIEEEQMEKDNIVTATLDEYNHKINGPETIGTIQAMYPVQNHGHRVIENPLRIRKLTPTECFRLMGVKDEDSCKLDHLSNSTKYHLAGDSIVVNVLQAIFKSVLIDNPVLENKPIRLIEFFAGYGSQALSFKYLNIPFESWKICEWAYKSIDAYKHIHHFDDHTDYSNFLSKEDLVSWLYERGISSNWNEPMKKEQIARKKESELREIYNNIKATHNLVNIQQVHSSDLNMVDRDTYNYIWTYSFPCQDLSLAGKGAGMEKGSGTRSGMLWEVERILEECGDNLPQLLLMENVPQVAGSKNKEHFDKWIEFLESKGYTNKWCMLNAKEVGYPEPIPQNRNRCFMVSVLNSKCDIVFPEKTERTMVLKDLLEHNVDEKYYLSEKMVEYIKANNEKWTGNNDKSLINKKVASALNTNEGSRRCDASNYMCASVGDDYDLKQVAEIRYDEGIRTFKDDVCGSLRTIDACGDKVILIKEATKQGYKEARDGDGVNICGRMKYQRGNVQEQSIQSLTTIGGNERAVVLDEDKWSDLD